MKTKTDELAASLGLKVVLLLHWCARHIVASDGRILAEMGMDAVPAWLLGYKAALGEAVRAIDVGDRASSPTGQVIAMLQSMGAPTLCPNPECRGGFVGGHDPHACGDC